MSRLASHRLQPNAVAASRVPLALVRASSAGVNAKAKKQLLI